MWCTVHRGESPTDRHQPQLRLWRAALVCSPERHRLPCNLLSSSFSCSDTSDLIMVIKIDINTRLKCEIKISCETYLNF